jgi:Zn-dependent protease with chaperone function
MRTAHPNWQAKWGTRRNALLACRRPSPAACSALGVSLAVLLVIVPVASAQRTQLKPGWNLFSPQQDVQIGQQNAAQADQQLPVVNDARITRYLNDLGRRLASHAGGPQFPYTFKLVNDRAINAFCLPGGFIYINRGIIENADNEAQLAGVMGHEIAHAALRHGTNQASKAYATQVGLGVLGGIFGGGNSVASLATQLGASFGAGSVLLKFSRDAERQADTLGAQILYDAGYDPRAIPQFFEKLEAETKKGRPPQFFSSHPNPENRIEGVNREIEKLGGPPANYRTDSAEFRTIKALVLALPAPPKGGKGSQPAARPTRRGTPDRPSSRMLTYEGRLLRMSYPENWQAYGGDQQELSGVTLAPEGGIVEGPDGNPALAYGMIVGVMPPQGGSAREESLDAATDRLIAQLQASNPRMVIDRRRNRVRLDGTLGLSIYFENESPVRGKEYGWLVTLMRREGLLHFVCVAPAAEYDDYEVAFQAMLSSVRFRR